MSTKKPYNKAIKILLATSTVGSFIFGIFSTFYVTYIQKIGGDIETAGSSLAVFSIVSGVLILTFASVESSIRNKRLLYAAGLLLRSLTFLLFMFVSTFFELLLVQILLGISVAMVNPSFDSLFTKWSNKEDSISDWSGWEGFTAISIGIASLVGGYIIQNFGFTVIFALMSLLSFSIGILVLNIKDETL
jgi:predicted MFS family arabinose efflux permease